MDEQIGALEDQIEEKNAEIETLQTDIASLDEEIAAKQVEIDETYEQFKERMVALYQAGETSSLAMLLSSDSFADFVTNVQLMQAVSESDQQLVNKLRTQKEEQQAQKDEKEAAEAEVPGGFDPDPRGRSTAGWRSAPTSSQPGKAWRRPTPRVRRPCRTWRP